jgi:hypothetical protein
MTFQDRIDGMKFRQNAVWFQDILDHFRQAVVVPNERLSDPADRVYKGSHHGLIFDGDGNVINGKKNSYTIQGPTLAQLEARRKPRPEFQAPDPRRVGTSGYAMLANAILGTCPDSQTKEEVCDYFAG